MANMVLDSGYVAAAAIPIFTAVKLASDTSVTPCTDATAPVIGICQETITSGDATLGRVANIRVQGVSRAINGVAGALARGARVMPDASGRMIVATGAGSFVCGVVTVAGAAQGDIIEIEIGSPTVIV